MPNPKDLADQLPEEPSHIGSGAACRRCGRGPAMEKVKFMATRLGTSSKAMSPASLPSAFIQLISTTSGHGSVSTMADDYYRFIEGSCSAARTRKSLQAWGQGEGAGHPRKHGRAAGRSRARGDSGAVREGGLTAAEQGTTQTREGRSKRLGRRERSQRRPRR